MGLGSVRIAARGCVGRRTGQWLKKLAAVLSNSRKRFGRGRLTCTNSSGSPAHPAASLAAQPLPAPGTVDRTGCRSSLLARVAEVDLHPGEVFGGSAGKVSAAVGTQFPTPLGRCLRAHAALRIASYVVDNRQVFHAIAFHRQIGCVELRLTRSDASLGVLIPLGLACVCVRPTRSVRKRPRRNRNRRGHAIVTIHATFRITLTAGCRSFS
jgi:hypothetical protein